MIRMLGRLVLLLAQSLQGLSTIFARASNLAYGLLPVCFTSSQLSRLVQESYTADYGGSRPLPDPTMLDAPLAPWEVQLLDRHGVSAGAMLVMGTGHGREAIAIARRGVRVAAMDTNFDAVRTAAQIARALKVGVSFQQADFRSLPYGARAFDFAFLPTLMYSAIQGREERQAWLRDVARLLRPEGKLLLSFLPLRDRPQSALHAVRPTLARLLARLPGANPGYQRGDHCSGGHFLHEFQDEHEIRSELQAIGSLLELSWAQGIAVVKPAESLTHLATNDILARRHGSPGNRRVNGHQADMGFCHKVFSKSADFVHREVAGESILIPLHRQLTDVKSLYVLNETGASLWRRIDGQHSIQSIMEDFSKEFDVNQEELEKDFRSLIDDLLSIRAVQEDTPRPDD